MKFNSGVEHADWWVRLRARGFLLVFTIHLECTVFANILTNWQRGFWNSRRLVYIWHLCRLQLFSHLKQPHQWWWTLYSRDFSSVPFPIGEEVMREAREVRFYIGWDLFPVGTCWHFSSSSVRLLWVPGHNNVAGNDIYFATLMAHISICGN